ncbi:hypothetical protein Bca4012_056293 [Brassica carinata]|uniref:RING-type E3 ubiquitin transferase n=1 Tax=Brassica carinata TaxID=52824 RepID=A0A8X7VZZ9_BRACI|nr:hypothetical protein Bca52824_013887 [Brassica carinata]
MSNTHDLHWCYRCFELVAVRTLNDEVMCCECNNSFVSFYSIPAAHSTGTEVLHPRRERNLERVINHLWSRYRDSLPNTLEGDNGNGARRGAPPAAKSAIEALETFEAGSTSTEEGERMAVLCAVCKDAMVMGEIGKKLPCGHCYHDNCILPWLETTNSCPVCRFQLRTDDPHYERKRAREEQPLTVIDGASSSSSISGRQENNDHIMLLGREGEDLGREHQTDI